MMGSALAWIGPGVFVGLLVWYFLVRMIRQRWPYPVPYFLVHLIDNPLRRMVQPLHKYPEQLGIKPGLTVLEIGPGSGTYTLAAAEAVGPKGRIVAVDIDDRVVRHVQRRVVQAGIAQVEVRQGDAQSLEFPDASFDAIYLIAVFGEFPDRSRALAEFRRVLVPGGTLALSEFYPDPDSQPSRRLQAECEAAGFRLMEATGNLFHYTMLYERPGE